MTVGQANDVLRLARGAVRLDGATVARYLEEETDDTAEDTNDVAARAFGDGGYLDNKPFGYAIDAGANRGRERPVQRKLFYIEPSPEQLDPGAGGDGLGEPPTALENVQAALLKVPRYESIREDLQRILARNRLVERVQRVTRGLEEDVRRRPVPPPASPSAEWAEQDLAAMIDRYGIAYGSYHRLKVAQVTDQIARSFAAAAGFRAGSDAFEAARHLVRAWRDHHYAHHVDRDRPGGRESFNRFLLTYDLEYRMRRLRFVLRELDTLALGGFDALAALRSEPDVPAAASAPPGTVVGEDSLDAIALAIAEVRPVIETLLAEFRATGARLLASGGANPVWPSEPPPTRADGQDHEAGIWPYLERSLMSLHSAAERDALARLVVADGGRWDSEHEDGRDAFARAMDAWLGRAVRGAAARVAETIEEISRRAASTIDELLVSDPASGDAGAKDYLRRQYDRFEEYDLVTYPILYATDGEGESATADVHRISPEDATSLSVNKHRLAGTALHNFGAFLDARWRRSDLRWGRLDAADRIITVLLPGPEHAALRASLIQEAQKAILEEDLVKHGQDELVRVMATAIGEDAPADVFGRTRKELEVAAAAVLPATADLDLIYATYGRADFDVDRTLDREAMFRNASRASRVIGSMLQDMAGPRGLARTPAEWVARASRAGWMLVETAMPGSPTRTVVRHLAAVFVLFSALLVGVGLLADGNDLRNLGLAWLAISIAFLGVQALAENFIRGGGALWRTLRVLAATLAVGVVYLAVVGARERFGWSFGLGPDRLDTVALGAGAILILAALLREARAMFDGLRRWALRASRWASRSVRLRHSLQRLRPLPRTGAEPDRPRWAGWPARALARWRERASPQRPGA
jgi:patatin-related protein